MNRQTLERLRKIALKAAEKSEHQMKLGAVIFNKNRLLSIGYNSLKTHPKLSRIFKHATVHAEIDACIHAVNKDLLKGADIFVCRETKNGSPSMAKPCAMCTQILKEYGVKRAFWTTEIFPYWDSANVEDMYNQIDRKECFETNCKKPKNPPEGKKKRD